ncbi:MAG: response regulator [Phenylobacterium zucineum]|nr:MAG: response regulator [Phenylobacterium zucineum]
MSLVERRARRVLVADDEPLVLELIVTRLSIAGFEVRGAKDGAQALDRLTDFRPEALVLDINMPKLDGFGVLSHMRAQGLSDKVPTLVLTARNAAEDVAKAIKLGAKDYLSKPFRDEQLIQRVGRLFNRARPVGG